VKNNAALRTLIDDCCVLEEYCSSLIYFAHSHGEIYMLKLTHVKNTYVCVNFRLTSLTGMSKAYKLL